MNSILYRLESGFEKVSSQLYVKRLFQESILLALTKMALEAFSQGLLISQHPAVKSYVWNRVVWQPFSEEVIFRGGILGGLKLAQLWYNQRKGGRFSNCELRTQQLFRVCVTGLLFGVAHLMNKGSFKQRILQCSINVLQGISYGFICEKIHTLSVPILAHAFPNVVSIWQKNEVLSPLQAHLCVAVYGIGLAILVWPCSIRQKFGFTFAKRSTHATMG